MSGNRGSGGGQQQQPTAPPATLWDRLAVAASAKTPVERTNQIGAIVSEVAMSGDINPLLQVLRDNRPQAQLGAICALVDPDIYKIYESDSVWRGAVASSISPLVVSADMATAITAAATVEYLLSGVMDEESINLIREDVAKARVSAGMALAIVLSYVEDKLP